MKKDDAIKRAITRPTGGWVPTDIKLSMDKRKKIIKLVGEQNFPAVEKAWQQYRGMLWAKENMISAANYRKALGELHDCIETLLPLMNDHHMKNILQTAAMLEWPETKRFTNDYTKAVVTLEYISRLAEGPYKKGKHNQDAESFLIHALYPLARQVNKGDLPVVDSGTVLHRLVEILSSGKRGTKIKKYISSRQRG